MKTITIRQFENMKEAIINDFAIEINGKMCDHFIALKRCEIDGFLFEKGSKIFPSILNESGRKIQELKAREWWIDFIKDLGGYEW